MPPPGGKAIAAIVALALLSTALAYLIFFRILRRAGATNLSLVTLLIPASAILLGALDQSREGAFRQPGVLIGGNGARDLAVAAVDQNFRQRLGDAEAGRQRQQMRLALGFRDIFQVGVADGGGFEHGPRHLDIVVFGERADDTGRRVEDRRDPAGEFRQRLGLDFLDQAAHDVVEQRDMLCVE